MARDWYVEKVKKTGTKPTKYDDKMRARILRLCFEKLKDYQIAMAVGIHWQTINAWRKKYPDLKSAMDRIRKEVAKQAIERGLDKLAEGYHEEEVTTESVEITDTGPKKIKRTRKYYPPSVKAMEMLASKHCPDDYLKKEVKETNVNVRITQKNRALSIEERIALLNKDKEDGAIAADYTVKDANTLELQDDSERSPLQGDEDIDV